MDGSALPGPGLTADTRGERIEAAARRDTALPTFFFLGGAALAAYAANAADQGAPVVAMQAPAGSVTTTVPPAGTWTGPGPAKTSWPRTKARE